MNQFQTDDELAVFNEQRKDKKRNLIMVVIVFLAMTGMIILDIVSKWRSARKHQRNLFPKKTDYQLVFDLSSLICVFLSATGNIHLETYFPFYIEYYTLMALHTQLAQTALGLQRRYHRLNLAIRNIFSLSKFPVQKNVYHLNLTYHVLKTEKLLETASSVKNQKSAKEPVKLTVTAETNAEAHLPGTNNNEITKPAVKLATLSRAPQDENHVAPIFITGKYSATLSTTTFGTNF